MATQANSTPAPAVQQGLLPPRSELPPEPLLGGDLVLPFAAYPRIYATRVLGGCCAPDIPDGASIVIDREAAFSAGDFVVIWHRGAGGTIQPVVKRLAMGIAPWARFPHRLEPDENVSPVVMCEKLNPPCLVSFDARNVYGIHRCIGVALPRPEAPVGTSVSSTDIRWFEPSQPKPATQSRKRRAAVAGAA